MSNRLTPGQKRTLAAMAREAYNHLRPGLDCTADEFRQEQAREATKGIFPPSGVTISEAPRNCFDEIYQHFKILKGQACEAFDHALSGEGSELRNMLHNMNTAAKAAGVGQGYISGICQRMGYGSAPKTVAQAKAVMIALQRKAAADKKKAEQSTAQEANA